MTEETAFVRSILADPANDSLRLVYADWLEERGDPRAEYLRLDVALASHSDAEPSFRIVSWWFRAPVYEPIERPPSEPRDTMLARRDELRRILDPKWLTLIDGSRNSIQSVRKAHESNIAALRRAWGRARTAKDRRALRKRQRRESREDES
jgi:uncharacterized protein (TIGR02996 family)